MTRCTPACIQPRPTNAHCSVCHRTFGTVTSFDRHRRGGACLDPAGLRMHPDARGVWRMDGDAASAFSREPQTADLAALVPASAPGPSEAAETISGGAAWTQADSDALLRDAIAATGQNLHIASEEQP